MLWLWQEPRVIPLPTRVRDLSGLDAAGIPYTVPVASRIGTDVHHYATMDDPLKYDGDFKSDTRGILRHWGCNLENKSRI